MLARSHTFEASHGEGRSSAAEPEQVRTSLYLVRRAEALIGALKFFANDVGNATERRLQFLAQSDFWEWELDNLAYSFETLAERSRTWASGAAATRKLNQLGVVVDAKIVRRVKWHGGWRVREDRRRVAPAELLREAVELWNGLIDRVEVQFVAPMRENADRYNIQTVRHLGHLRKSVPPVLADGHVNDAAQNGGVR